MNQASQNAWFNHDRSTVGQLVYTTRSMARHIDLSLQILKELQVSVQIPNYMAYIVAYILWNKRLKYLSFPF